MTAEQALIEENKKDPRKKYITKDINGNTEFWAAKPFINHETGQWKSEGFLISIVLNDIEIDFSRKDWQECILCIEDIKPEVPPIPEKLTTHFYSTICWIEDRINYINQFIKRNIDSDLCINPDWVTERNELIEKLKNL